MQRRFLDAQHGKVYSQLIRCALDDGIYGSAKIAVTGSMYADAVAATEVLNEFGDNPSDLRIMPATVALSNTRKSR